MTISANFAGRILTQPGSLSTIDSTALNNPQLGYTGIVAIIGSCLSGPPKTPVLFNSPGQLKASLGSGNAYDGARMAFNPSTMLVEGNYVRPQLVYVVRADAAVQAALTLDDANAADSITFTSVDYGFQTNQVSVKITAPSPNNDNSNAVNASIKYGTSTETFTDMGMVPVFTLNYGGSCTTAVATVSATGIVVTISGAGSGDSFTALFSEFDTLRKFKEKAESVSANFTVTENVANPTTYTLSNLDYLSNVDIKAVSTKFYDVLYQVVTTINAGSALVTTARATGASLPPDYTATYTYLAGGTTNGSGTGPGSPSTQDYSDSLTALQQYRINYVALATGVTTTSGGGSGAGLGSTFAAWLDTMQGVNECHGHVGTYVLNGATVTPTPTFANMKALALEINDVNCNLWTDAIMVPNDTGTATWYDSWMTACMAAGFQAGTPPGTSFVQKSFNILNAAHYEANPDLLNPYTYGDALVLARLSFMKFNDATKSWNIVRALTTYSADGNDYNTEPGIRSAVNYAVYSIRQDIEQKFLGARTLFNQYGSTADSAKNELLSYGRLLEDANVIIKGSKLENNQIVILPSLVVDSVTISGDILRLRYGIRPIGSINWIFHTINLNSVQQVATT